MDSRSDRRAGDGERPDVADPLGPSTSQSLAAGRRSRCPGVVRRRRIVQVLRRSGYVQAADLTTMFGVSEMTIRRDLDELVRQGFGVRVWGGLVSPGLASAKGTAVLDRREERLLRARHHLMLAEHALDDGQLAAARDHVREILRDLDEELVPRAVSARR